MWNSPLPRYPVWMISYMRRIKLIATAFLLFAGVSMAASCARENGGEEPLKPQNESPDSQSMGASMTAPEKDAVLMEIVEGEMGAVQVRVEGKVFSASKENTGFSDLEDFLTRSKKEFVPMEDVQAFRVLVRQGKGVDFKFVLAVLKVCEKAGVTNIRFDSAPIPIAEEIEQLVREKNIPKQK